MQDYCDYNFSVNINDVTKLIQLTVENGCPALLYVNGMYYDIKSEDNKQ